MTTQSIAECVRRGVRISALSSKGRGRFFVSSGTGGNVHLRMALYRALSDKGQSLALSKVIVAAKLQNSRFVVSRWSRDSKGRDWADDLATRASQIFERVSRLDGAPTSDHVRGIEGDAARIYFGAIARVVSGSALSFSKRTRRPPRDPVNALLSFCYGMLTSECIGAVEAVGLDHQIGFFHRPRSGRPSLALDLAEEFRALTDRFVVSLVRRRQVRPDSFVETAGGGIYLSDEGRDMLVRDWEDHKSTELQHTLLGRKVERWALPGIQATLLARYLRDDIPAYPPFVMA